MPLTLPTSPNSYSRSAEQERSRKLEAADKENWKRNQNIQIAGGATLSFQATDGSNWSFGVNGDGSVYMKNVATGVVVPIGGGSGNPPELETDGVANPVQSLLNLIGGSNVTLTADAAGGVTIDAAAGQGLVQSVFGRQGAVIAYKGDYTAAQVTNAVDSTQSYADPAWISSLAWSKITGVPAAGVSSVFGRTGAVVAAAGDYTASEVTNAVDATQTYANPVWITSLDWSKITNPPSVSSYQTPWLSDIDGGGYALSDVDQISVGGLAAQSGVPLIVGSWQDTCMQLSAGSGDTNIEIEFEGNTRWNVGVGLDSASYGAGLFYLLQEGGSIAFCINSSDYVGIGNTSPQFPLDVAGDANITGVYRINGTPISFGVSSVFGRSGAVVAAAGDYTVSQVTGALADPTTTLGDLLVRTSSAVTRLPLGTNGYVLTADNTQTTGVKWAAAAGGSGSGTVTSVALSMPAEFSVAGSPVTTTGTLAVTKATQAVNLIYAGPGTGTTAAAPTFRALVAADLPSGTGTVTSVALTMPAEFTVSGSPITTSGTLSVAKATQAANIVYAGPASGSAVAPAFRALVAGDLPAATTTAIGAVMLARDLGGTDTAPQVIGIRGANISSTAPTNGQVLEYVSSTSTWTPTTLGTGGSVTSVALTMPSDFTVGGSPITTSGTLAVTRATQAKNLVLAGPASGSNAAPTYRALVTADLPSGVGTVTSAALTMPAEFAVAGSPITTSGTFAVTKATQSANLIYAGPASGSAAAPGFRALAAADFPAAVVSGFQTPWLQNINAAGYSLNSAGYVNINGASANPVLNTVTEALNITFSSAQQLGIGGYPSGSYGIWFQGKKSDGTSWPLVLQPLAGYVGIGTSTPQAKLSLGTDLTTIKVAVYDDGSGSGIYGIGVNSNQLTFGAALAGNNVAPQMVLTSGGSLGINQTNPQATLDVNGAISSSSSISSHGSAAAFFSDDRNNTSYSWGFYAGNGSARIWSSQYGGDQFQFAPGNFEFGNFSGPNVSIQQVYMNSGRGTNSLFTNMWYTGSGFGLIDSSFPGIMVSSSVYNNSTSDCGFGIDFIAAGSSTLYELFGAQYYQGYVYTTLAAGNGANIDAQLQYGGQWYTYANNTQLYFRMRGWDGVMRQAVLSLS